MHFAWHVLFSFFFREPSSTDHHAPLFKRSWETVNNNVNYTVNYWLTKGFPAAEIKMGIPTYGEVSLL